MEYINFKSSILEKKAKSEVKRISETFLIKVGNRTFVSKEGSEKVTKIRIHSSDFINDDLKELAYFPQLKVLEIFSFGITDLSNIPLLKQLETICLRSGKISMDLKPIEIFSNLKKIDIEGCRITDLSPLSNLRKLRSLNLGFNDISDLSALHDLVSVTELVLNTNRITDITPISTMKKLKTLCLEGNKITDISSLEGQKKLKTLCLHGNEILDITPLASCENLVKLEIYKNKIESAEPILHLPHLEYVVTDSNIVFEPLSDYFEKTTSKVFNGVSDKTGYEIWVFRKRI
jgi:Leucine-rich repeat (LRR) protein